MRVIENALKIRMEGGTNKRLSVEFQRPLFVVHLNRHGKQDQFVSSTPAKLCLFVVGILWDMCTYTHLLDDV